MYRRLCLILTLTALFAGCASGPGIPGEAKLVAENIAAEYYFIGETYFELKNYAKAAEYYLKVIKNPAFATQAQYKLARSYVFAKQWSNAVEIYQKLVKADPQNTNLNMSLAYVLATSGDVEGALKIYDELMSKEYFDPVLLQNLVLLHLAANNLEEAELKLNLFKERFPEDEKIYKLEERLQKAKQPVPVEQDSAAKDSADIPLVETGLPEEIKKT